MNNNESICAICFDPMTSNDPRTNCNHQFHRGCLEHWRGQQFSQGQHSFCALCRQFNRINPRLAPVRRARTSSPGSRIRPSSGSRVRASRPTVTRSIRPDSSVQRALPPLSGSRALRTPPPPLSSHPQNTSSSRLRRNAIALSRRRAAPPPLYGSPPPHRPPPQRPPPHRPPPAQRSSPQRRPRARGFEVDADRAFVDFLLMRYQPR